MIYRDRILSRLRANKVLVQNFSYLSVLQVVNLLIPLVTYPYLIRVLGKDVYGLVVFAQALVAYLVIIVSYGFHVSAVKQISINRDNMEKINEIVSSVLIIKSILLILTFLLLGILLYLIEESHGYEALFCLSMWSCVYDVIFPVWFFQGIEKMKYITYITLLSRVIFLGFIFVFIKSSFDLLYIPIINGFGAIVAGIISLYIVFVKLNVKFSFQPLKILMYYLKDSTAIFITNVSSRFYYSTNKVIVGSFLGMAEVAYYDFAEKIVALSQIPIVLATQTVFPKISRDRCITFINKITKYQIILVLFLCVLIEVFAKQIAILLGGTQMLSAGNVLKIMILSSIFVSIYNSFATLRLLPFGYNKDYIIVVSSTAFCYFLLIGIFYFFGLTIYSIAVIAVLVQVWAALVAIYFSYKHNLLR